MSESIVGIVEEVINNGKGKGSGIRINGRKYGVYDPADAGLDEVAAGTTVSFRFSEKESGGKFPYLNVQGKITTVKDGTALTATSGSSGGGKRYRANGEEGGFPIHPQAYERALDRRNALTAAVALATANKISDTKKIVEIAREFEAYTTGDIDVDALASMSLMDDEF